MANQAASPRRKKLVKEYPRQGATATLGKIVRPHSRSKPKQFRAVDGISFSVGHGESVGLVGESGLRKSTTSMMVMRLLDQTSGRIHVRRRRDRPPSCPMRSRGCHWRKSIQMVFQDPTAASTRASTAARAIVDPIMQLGDIKGRAALRAAARNSPAWWATRQSAGSLPASVVGWPESSRRHRTRDRAAPKLVPFSTSRPLRSMSPCRRVVLNLVARLEAVDGHELSVRVARFECSAVVVRSCHCDADGPNRRAGCLRTGYWAIRRMPIQGSADGDSTSAVAGLVYLSCSRKRGIQLITGVLLDRPVKPGDDEERKTTLTAKTTDPLDDYIDAVSKALALPVEEAWRPAVRANLEVSLRLARLVDEFALPTKPSRSV